MNGISSDKGSCQIFVEMPVMGDDDRRMLLEYLRVKYQSFVDELHMAQEVTEVDVELVDRTAARLLDGYPEPDRINVGEDGHLRELQQLMIDFSDWVVCDDCDRQKILEMKFVGLLFALGCGRETAKAVLLTELD